VPLDALEHRKARPERHGVPAVIIRDGEARPFRPHEPQEVAVGVELEAVIDLNEDLALGVY